VPLLPLLLASTAWATGAIEVRASIPGGRILVDGADTGARAPTVIEDVQAGRHTVTLVAPCLRGEARVEVKDGATAQILVEVAPAGGTLVVDLEPPEAALRMDGAPYPGEAGQPLAVSCGDHGVAASHEGYLPMFVTFSVTEGEVVDLPIALTPIGRGRLRVDVTPEDARVTLDGVALGQGDQDVPDVPAGPHRVEASRVGFQTFQRNLLVDDGQTVDLTADLQALPAALPAGGRGPRIRKGAGATMTAVGAAGLMASGAMLLLARDRYGTYLDRAAAINAGTSSMAPAQAQRWRDEQVVPMATGGVVAGGAGLLLTGAGVALLVRP
jgi:hypothetical protein